LHQDYLHRHVVLLYVCHVVHASSVHGLHAYLLVKGNLLPNGPILDISHIGYDQGDVDLRNWTVALLIEE